MDAAIFKIEYRTDCQWFANCWQLFVYLILGRKIVMEKLIVGLCAGRHDLPVSQYIFDEISDPSNVNEIQNFAYEWVNAYCHIHTAYREGVNQAEQGDQLCYVGDHLIIYVTGLTVALTAVIRACAENGVSLTLRHYNTQTGGYTDQLIFMF